MGHGGGRGPVRLALAGGNDLGLRNVSPVTLDPADAGRHWHASQNRTRARGPDEVRDLLADQHRSKPRELA